MNEVKDGNRKCEVCGKDFWITDIFRYTYKRFINYKIRYYCSWTCFRKHDNISKAKRKVRCNI